MSDIRIGLFFVPTIEIEGIHSFHFLLVSPVYFFIYNASISAICSLKRNILLLFPFLHNRIMVGLSNRIPDDARSINS